MAKQFPPTTLGSGDDRPTCEATSIQLSTGPVRAVRSTGATLGLVENATCSSFGSLTHPSRLVNAVPRPLLGTTTHGAFGCYATCSCRSATSSIARTLGRMGPRDRGRAGPSLRAIRTMASPRVSIVTPANGSHSSCTDTPRPAPGMLPHKRVKLPARCRGGRIAFVRQRSPVSSSISGVPGGAGRRSLRAIR